MRLNGLAGESVRSNPVLLFASFAALIFAGCATNPPGALSGPSAPAHSSPSAVRDSAPIATPHPGKKRPPPTTEELIKLKAYEVKESAFSDFGMSVKTNFEVIGGGDIEWMLISAVAPGSSAARMNLGAGDRILAIDGRQVTELNRDAMLERLFQRKKGETSRLLVLGRRDALPRFVILSASRPEG
jgi:hypothetical protein